LDKLPTYIPTHIPQRQEAVDLGLHFYGEVREVYKDADEDEFEATLLFMLGRLNNVVTTRQLARSPHPEKFSVHVLA